MGYRVVIIDDEPWTREVLRSLGEWDRLGLSVAGEASDGESGLALIRQLHPDIVLTDIRMPLMSGLELLEALRREDSRARVIMVSGYDDFGYARSALRMDATDYLLKPVKAAELNAQLQKCIDQLDRALPGGPAQDVSGFMDAPWVQRYMPLRAALQAQLTAGDTAALSSSFARIEGVIDPPPARTLLIALYYDLVGMLERHVVAAGYRIGEVVTGGGIVFSGETTLAEVLGHVQAQYAEALERLEALIRSQRGLNMAQVVSYAQAHATQGVTLEQTARQFFVTPEYLSRVFKAHTGQGFSEYTMGLRMQKAKELLASGAPAKELHTALGFSEQANFYKVFKRYFGVTPGEMQKKFKNG
ncbi:MAG TPA: response regulator [Candidatus Limiplasma sp.]|nr:response regulator [Candidatus Limiplasma sp.]HPR77134.1 response regulator [Candidatus Limiplasma sp.]